jgi:hypothetical protein
MPNHRVCSIGFTVFCTLAFSIFLCTTALAQNWQNPAGGDFNNGANWAGGQFPTNPVFNLNSSGYTATLSSSADVQSLTVQNDNPTINLNGMTLGVGTGLGTTVNIASQAGQTGSLTLVGPGTLAVSDSPGNVIIGTGGQLTINGAELSQSGNGQNTQVAGPLTIENGGSLVVDDGGAPFNATAPITITTGGMLNSFYGTVSVGTLNIELGPSNYSTDSVSIYTLKSSGPVNIALAPGFTPTPLHNLDVARVNDYESGSFRVPANLPALPNGETWDTSEFSNFGELQVVPEPAGSAILVAAGGLLLRRRSERK